ncbi:MAG: hypothetical protein WCW31_04160 [Patescibacteria group bacterium]|jgi:hypothetical protein
MIPVYYFVIAWLIFLGVFVLIALVSVMQMLRFGLAHWLTYFTTVAFVGLSAIIIVFSLYWIGHANLLTELNLNSIFGNPTMTS